MSSCTSVTEESTEIVDQSESDNGNNDSGSNDNNDSGNNNSGNDNSWSIPVNEVLDGGPGKDGIPALQNPNLVNAQTASQGSGARGNDLVLGIKSGDEVRAYPHIILDWHEIINENVGSISVAITYCPLTGTGIGWNRIITGEETTFGVSGLLYNTNLIPYDRLTDSNWSQILNESVNGSLLGTEADLIQLVETDWETWTKLYPNTEVVSTNTGYSRPYGTSPYGDYSTNNSFFLFPVDKDNRLPLKERVYAIVEDDKAKVYQFSDFGSGSIVLDSFMGKSFIIIGNENFITAFEITSQFSDLTFQYAFENEEDSDIILTDDEGNTWDLFGNVISGPRLEQSLVPSNGFMGFWFSIPAFYETEIYSE